MSLGADAPAPAAGFAILPRMPDPPPVEPARAADGFEFVSTRAPAPAPRRPGLWLHAALFLATAFTACVAGAVQELEEGDAGRPAALLDGDVLLRGVPYAAALLAVLGAHEMGHYAACRRYRIPATLPFFIPGLPILGTFGAVIRIRGIIPNRKALFDVAAAGPIAGFLVALPILVLGLVRAVPAPEPQAGGNLVIGQPLISRLLHAALLGSVPLRVDSLYVAGWVGMLVTSMNLFPVGQLDGGHAAYALSRKAHRWLSRSTIVALFVLVSAQTVRSGTPPVYALWLVVLLVLRDRHPRLADESEPLGSGRALLALVLAALFAVTFIPVPFRLS